MEVQEESIRDYRDAERTRSEVDGLKPVDVSATFDFITPSLLTVPQSNRKRLKYGSSLHHTAAAVVTAIFATAAKKEEKKKSNAKDEEEQRDKKNMILESLF